MSPVLTDLRAAAVLARISSLPVLADARTAAVLAHTSVSSVLADLRTATVLALRLPPPVLAFLVHPLWWSCGYYGALHDVWFVSILTSYT